MRNRMLRCRPFSARLVVLLLLGLAFAAYCYYYTTSLLPYSKSLDNGIGHSIDQPIPEVVQPERRRPHNPRGLGGRRHFAALHNQLHPEQCEPLASSVADVDTVTTYPTFDFQSSWIRTKEFWDKFFEDRYEVMKNDSRRLPLKVFVVPHSHNDPGWLKTFEQYFEWKTKNIITNIVQKLIQYPNMTFIWTEISFLNSWWERAHPSKQKELRKLVTEGRLEITTGGWVMPDEANTHIYALVDQFIEGHSWVKTNLGISPKTGWSIDPFGHGPTVPHLLEQSGLDGAVIQRIHYAWKQWLAYRQMEQFHWLPGWAAKRKPSLLVHNQPFDIYSIKSTCGPHPAVCLGFDFRKIPGEYSEYTSKHEEITEQNLHAKSKTLLEGYERIGSLTPHNVVLVPLGDDFRYEHPAEFDAQYVNYMKMFNYINGHRDMLHADVRFGTPLEYFRAVRERHHDIPTLKGDFFVYSDIFSEGKPAYWSGYFTTRPYLKILTRQFEHQLRTAEILFTLVSNFVKQSKNPTLVKSEKRLEKSYEQLIGARRNLGLFQHHDAITGTSKAVVMYDYGTKLFTSLYHCIRLQELALTTLMIPNETLHSQSILQSEVEWENYGKPIKKIHVSLANKNKVIIFNSLIEPRTEVITIKCNSTNVRIYDTYNKKYVPYQIAPKIDVTPDGKHVVSDVMFDVLFEASLPPLAAVTYAVEEHANTSHHCHIFCNNCVNPASQHGGTPKFQINKMMAGDIQLENKALTLLINRNTGFMRQIYRKDINKKNVVDMTFGAYQSAQRHSGAYLFMPDNDAPEKNILAQYASSNNISGLGDDNIIIIAGPISTEIITLYLPFLVHSVRIYHVDDPALSTAVYMENLVDFEAPPKNRETELFLRIQTDIQNGEPPEFFTDQNGYQYQKRVKVSKLGIEGNYYPITTTAWLQDEETRLTLLTNHAQGAAAAEPGRIELMLERRTLYDDSRGMGEGVVDNKPTLFQNWLLLESVESKRATQAPGEPKQRIFNAKPTENKPYELPSHTASYLTKVLNYPPNVYVTDTSDVGDFIEINTHRQFVQDFPAGLHLVNLRTITDDILEQFPSSSCYMVLQRPGCSCSVGNSTLPVPARFSESSEFSGLVMYNLTAVSLTGLHSHASLNGLHEIQLDQMDLKTYRIRF